jgi:cell division protein FtsQ
MLAVILAVLCLLGGIGYTFLRTYTIETVYVEGNVHYSKEEIQEIVMDGVLGNNSLFLSLKYRNKGIEGVPFVDVMHVTVLEPDTIRISVYEKILTGYIKHLGSYMYFDKDGYVVESSSVLTLGVPQILGLEFDHVVLGEQLPVEDPKVFNNILDVTKLLNDKYNQPADKIYFSKTGAVTLYFGEIKVALGDDMSTLEDKLDQLPGMLSKLQWTKGTFHMQNYKANGRYTFKPE